MAIVDFSVQQVSIDFYMQELDITGSIVYSVRKCYGISILTICISQSHRRNPGPEPENIQTDKVVDASANGLDASYPAAGASLVRPVVRP